MPSSSRPASLFFLVVIVVLGIAASLYVFRSPSPSTPVGGLDEAFSSSSSAQRSEEAVASSSSSEQSSVATSAQASSITQASSAPLQTQAQGADSPSHAVTAFYQEWIAHKGSALADKSYRQSQMLTPRMIASLDSAASSPDPVYCADKRPPHFEVSMAKQAPSDTVTIHVMETYADRSFQITVTTVKTPQGTWLVDAVHCPTAAPGRAAAKAGEFCGGIAGIQCEQDLTCEYEGSYPDAGGTCR